MSVKHYKSVYTDVTEYHIRTEVKTMDKSKKNIGAIIGEYGAFIARALLVIIISCVSP